MAFGGKPVSGKRQKQVFNGERATPSNNPRNYETHPSSGKTNPRPAWQGNKD